MIFLVYTVVWLVLVAVAVLFVMAAALGDDDLK